MSHTVKSIGRIDRDTYKEMYQRNIEPIWSRRSKMEVIHLMRQMMEYYRARRRDLHMVYIELKKAYEKIPREVLW